MISLLLQSPAPVLWVQVPKPSFDLIGVVLSSLALSGAVAALGLTLGFVFGLMLLRRTPKPHPRLDLSRTPAIHAK